MQLREFDQDQTKDYERDEYYPYQFNLQHSLDGIAFTSMYRNPSATGALQLRSSRAILRECLEKTTQGALRQIHSRWYDQKVGPRPASNSACL